MLRYSTWGLQESPDPFKHAFPTVAYLPRGTIVFESGPGIIRDYVSVLLQYGHRVQIFPTIKLTGGEPVSILRPIEGLLEPPPSNGIVLHQSILCLRQGSTVVPPPGRCLPTSPDEDPLPPVGKGWVLEFRDHSTKPDWIVVTVNLDNETRREISERGWDPAEGTFDITRQELAKYESLGYLTALNKEIPPTVFEYMTRAPILIPCGQKVLTENTINTAAKNFGDEGKVNWSRFVNSLQRKLGLTLQEESSPKKNKKWMVSVDTSQESYVYEFVTMTENDEFGEGYEFQSTILIEKVFECNGSEPGERIKRVRFEVEAPASADVPAYDFTNPEKYLPVPDMILEHHRRPIFLSVNSAEQYERLFSKILEYHALDQAALVHFMIVHLNNTCTAARRARSRCAKAIDDAISALPDS